MKKKLFVLLLAAVCCTAISKADVVLDETNFPDANFRAAITNITGVAEDGTLTDATIAEVTSLSLDSKSISTLKGIEYFTALKYLDCMSNQLTTLDMSNNTALISLNCYNNKLTSLVVSNNTALTSLVCSSNQLTSLDVSNNTALTYLVC